MYDTSHQPAMYGVYKYTVEWNFVNTTSVLQSVWPNSNNKRVECLYLMLLANGPFDTVEWRPTDSKCKFWEFHQVQNLEQANTCVSFPSNNMCSVLSFGIDLLLLDD